MRSSASRACSAHPAFTWTNPNRVRAVLGAFAMANLPGFHRRDGAGYRLLADKVLELDRRNPQVAARLLGALGRWRRFDQGRQALMRAELERVVAAPGCRAMPTRSRARAWRSRGRGTGGMKDIGHLIGGRAGSRGQRPVRAGVQPGPGRADRPRRLGRRRRGRPRRAGGRCRPSRPGRRRRCCGAMRVMFKLKELLERDTRRLARADHRRARQDAGRTPRARCTRGIEVVEFACGIPQLLKGEFSRPGRHRRRPACRSASRSACAPASRRSTSRPWCRCG